METIRSFVFDHPLLYVLVCSCLMAVTRYLLVVLYSSVGRWILPTLSRRSKIKFAESLFFCTYYTFTFLTGFTIVFDQPYFWDTRYYWLGFPHSRTETTAFYMLYLFQLGYYISAFFYELNLVRNERASHSDHKIMILHHSVTIALIWFSYAVGYTRIGAIVFILHDCSDIILEFCKSTHYVKLKCCNIPAKNFLFPLFALVFFVSRLVLYPWRCLVPAFFEVKQVLPNAPYVLMFNIFLWILQVLHIFWFYLIVRMIVRALRVKELERDIRSDDEENEEMEQNSKNFKRSQQSEEEKSTNDKDHHNVDNKQNGTKSPKKTQKKSVKKDD